jgi:WD40 repeat protein
LNPEAAITESGEVWSVAFSPDGRRIAFGGWEKTIGLWDATRGTRIPTEKEDGDVFQVSFSPPDGKYLASSAVTADRQAVIVNVRDATTGEVVHSFPFQDHCSHPQRFLGPVLGFQRLPPHLIFDFIDALQSFPPSPCR